MFLKLGNRKKRGEEGFTLWEVIVASGIISVVLLSFSILLIKVGSAQNVISRDATVTRVLASEMNKTASMRFVDLFMANPSNSSCVLSNGESSGQSINPGPEIVSTDGMTINITRLVTWASSGTAVYCDSAATDGRDSDDMKQVTITVTWYQDGLKKNKSLSEFRSKYAER